MAETWLSNGATVQVDGNDITFSHGITTGTTVAATGNITSDATVIGDSGVRSGSNMQVDYDTVSNDTAGITFYYGDDTDPRDGTYILDCYDDGSREVFRVIVPGTQLANVYDTAGWRAGSARHNKEEIRDITDSELIDLLITLKNDVVKRYKRKNSIDGDEIGVIAEEGNDFITGGNHECIAPIKYCGYLHAVIKGLYLKMENMQAQINELKGIS